jgi:hypothetical protein
MPLVRPLVAAFALVFAVVTPEFRISIEHIAKRRVWNEF